MEAYQWLILYLIKETEKKQDEAIKEGADRFTARNESQVYRAAVLSRSYGEYTALRYFWTKFATADGSLRNVLSNLGM